MEKITNISFPGLGIGEFAVKNIAFQVGPFTVMWYGIIITVGIILAFLYFSYRGKKHEGLTDDDIFDYTIAAVICGIIGSRVYYVATKFEDFKGETFLKTLYNSIAIWNGGLAFYGALIGGALSVFVYSLIKKKFFLKVYDAASLGVMIAQVCGRWGNFMNGEAYGEETTLPWRMGLRSEYQTSAIYVHPTFLYESLWNLIGFLIINATYKHKKFDGQIAFRYLTWYGFGRMLIEGLRTDSLYVGEFRISQVVGFVCFFFGSAILIAYDIFYLIRKKKQGKTIVNEEKESVSENVETVNTLPETDETLAKVTETNCDENPNETDMGFDLSKLHEEDNENGNN